MIVNLIVLMNNNKIKFQVKRSKFFIKKKIMKSDRQPFLIRK